MKGQSCELRETKLLALQLQRLLSEAKAATIEEGTNCQKAQQKAAMLESELRVLKEEQVPAAVAISSQLYEFGHCSMSRPSCGLLLHSDMPALPS